MSESGGSILDHNQDQSESALYGLFFVAIALFLGKLSPRECAMLLTRVWKGHIAKWGLLPVGIFTRSALAWTKLPFTALLLVTSAMSEHPRQLCMRLDLPNPTSQVWGVLLGIGNETYTKNWDYVGPGIAVWEV